MRSIGVTELRANIAAVLDSVVDDAEEVVITRGGKAPVVVVSLRDYQSLIETEYLLSSPANARWLRESIAEAGAGQVEPHELIDPDEAGTGDAA